MLVLLWTQKFQCDSRNFYPTNKKQNSFISVSKLPFKPLFFTKSNILKFSDKSITMTTLLTLVKHDITYFPLFLKYLLSSIMKFDNLDVFCFLYLNIINQIWIMVANFAFDFYTTGKYTGCGLFWYILLVFYWIITWKNS